MADNTTGTKKVAYEGMFIFDANRLARDPQGLPGEIAEMIESAGGELEVSRLWEERRLAYPIKGQRKGAYWITYFHLPSDQLAPLTKQCEIKDGILRQLFIRLPDSLVEPIIEHAKGATAGGGSTSSEPSSNGYASEEAPEEMATN
ncbi:MAG: 30S ribosomal protein S6 [Planctomycetales bacterium]|nr:30S ribosomal protein S6 [Planctomycetales bacterium]